MPKAAVISWMAGGLNHLEGENDARHGAHHRAAQGHHCQEPIEKWIVGTIVADSFIGDVFLVQGAPGGTEKKHADEAQHDDSNKGVLRGGGEQMGRHFRHGLLGRGGS